MHRMALAWFAAATVAGRVVNFEDVGGVADKSDLETCWENGRLLNTTLNGLEKGDTFLLPNKTFHTMGGILVNDISDVSIQIDGTLSYNNDKKQWPRRTPGKDGKVLMCMKYTNITNVNFTSSGTGTFQGNGGEWWGIPGIGYLEIGENRPRLFQVENGRNLLVENLMFLQSPYWTFTVNVDGMEVRNCHISARRTDEDGHGSIDITAFNTDGYDVTGKNVWIHDCTVWNQDDCIAVKDGSENMLFERIEASGLGLTIGSIGSSVVRNITFRDCHMHKTVKGIYTKFRSLSSPGSISDVLYENIVIDEPEQVPIWIGPAQQSDSANACAGHPCSLCWPETPGAKCGLPAFGSYANITLRNITVNNPKESPGVIMANITNPMVNVVFDDVVVNNPGKKPWGDQYYHCIGVSNGVATGKTWPVPPCFKNETTY